MERSLLFVHAHPDDESITTGATMAKYAAEGARVTLVTCTLGEEGEVIPPDLAHLAPDRDDALGPYRIGELEAAMKALGVEDQRFLGGPGRWRDSGMMGVPQNDRADCFWRADVDEAAGLLVEVIKEVRPQALITYDEYGYYGHPDHIQAHRVSARAFEMVRRTPYEIPKFYMTAMPQSVAAATFAEILAAGPDFEIPAEPDAGVPDDQVTTRIDARAYLDSKLGALRAHATQIMVDPPWFALSNNIAQEALGEEYYVLRDTAVTSGMEGDLFDSL